MNNLLSCPQCGLSHIKHNGHTHYGKQNQRCLSCGRQFVTDSQRISHEDRARLKRLRLKRLRLKRLRLKRLRLKRLSRLGICRVYGISWRWLLSFVADLYEALPEDLNVRLPQAATGQVKLLRLPAEADEMWSFVDRKQNQLWLWIAIDTQSKQIIAFYVGDRSRQSARQLWNRMPLIDRQQANFDTDDWQAYKGVIPEAQHQVCAQGSGKTNIIERFNYRLRQSVSR